MLKTYTILPIDHIRSSSIRSVTLKEALIAKKKVNWHQILQDVLEEHLDELTGMEIKERSREYQKRIRLDYYCELNPNVSNKNDDTLRPFAHFKRYNVIEFKSYHEPLSLKAFVNHVGRTLFVQSKGDDDRWNQVCLTIILGRMPRAFLDFCILKKITFTEIHPWLIEIKFAKGVGIYLLLLTKLRDVKIKGPISYLQAMEANPRYQHKIWKRLLDQDTLYGKELKRIIMQIDREGLMTYLESIKAEATQKVQAQLDAQTIALKQEEAARKKEEAARKQEEAARKQEEAARKQEEAARIAAEKRALEEQQKREALEAKLNQLLGNNPGLAF